MKRACTVDEFEVLLNLWQNYFTIDTGIYIDK